MVQKVRLFKCSTKKGNKKKIIDRQIDTQMHRYLCIYVSMYLSNISHIQQQGLQLQLLLWDDIYKELDEYEQIQEMRMSIQWTEQCKLRCATKLQKSDISEKSDEQISMTLNNGSVIKGELHV